MEDLARQIGKRLKDARIDAQLTQEEAGSALGIGRAGYSNIENGRSLLTIDHLIKLPSIFHKPITYFLGINGNSNVEQEIIELWKVLPEAHQIAILETLRNLAVHYGKKE